MKETTLAPPGAALTGDHGAVLDDAHVGDIRGALGTIARGDVAPVAGCRGA